VEKERENKIDMGKRNGDRIYVPGQNRRRREIRGMVEELVTKMEMVNGGQGDGGSQGDCLTGRGF
jgi:hypothetical protein